MKALKYTLFFILFFLLFYLESYKVTNLLTFSQLWKIPLVLFMIGYIIRNQTLIRPVFVKVGYLLGIKNLFNPGLFINPFSNIIETIRFTNFPLLYDTINIYFKETEKLERFIIRISQYFILSSIPFLLGMIESIKDPLEFGEEESYIGIFQNAHGASIVSALAVLVIIFYVNQGNFRGIWKLFNIALIILGLYCLYMSFVRTGYLMFIVGLIVIYFPNKFLSKRTLRFLVILGILTGGFYFIMESNQSFKYRILDKNDKGDQKAIGSGRLVLSRISLKYWSEGTVLEMIFGRGLDNVMDNIKEKTGRRLFTHNGFVDTLAVNGLIGLLLLLFFLFYLLISIFVNKGKKSYRLALAFYFGYISFQTTQGGAAFPMDLFIVSVLNLLNKEAEGSIY